MTSSPNPTILPRNLKDSPKLELSLNITFNFSKYVDADISEGDGKDGNSI